MQLDLKELDQVLNIALAEDIGKGDITSHATIDPGLTATFRFVSREKMVVCGAAFVGHFFKKLDPNVEIEGHAKEGEEIEKDTIILSGKGNARTLLTGERTILNLMQHLSGVASLTKQYVKAVDGTHAKIVDTRKTIPGLRALAKYAVKVGGGFNHRVRLDDGVLIKDNHIAVCGGVAEAIRRARASTPLLTKIEVECDTLEQLEEAIVMEPDIIMLDNMNLGDLEKAVQRVDGKIHLEASGGVSLDTVRAIAETGVNYISVGKLTHSAPASDISLEIEISKS